MPILWFKRASYCSDYVIISRAHVNLLWFTGKTGDLSNDCLLQAVGEKLEDVCVLAPDIKHYFWLVTLYRHKLLSPSLGMQIDRTVQFYNVAYTLITSNTSV